MLFSHLQFQRKTLRHSLRSSGIQPIMFWPGSRNTIATAVPSFRVKVGLVVPVIHLGLSLPLFSREFPMSISTPLSPYLGSSLMKLISDTLYTAGSWSLHHGFSSCEVLVQLLLVYNSGLLVPPTAVED